MFGASPISKRDELRASAAVRCRSGGIRSLTSETSLAARLPAALVGVSLVSLVAAIIVAPEKYGALPAFDMAFLALSGLVAAYFGATAIAKR